MTESSEAAAAKPVKKSKLKEYVIFGSLMVVIIGSICWVLGGQMQTIMAAKFTPMFMKQAVLNLKELPAESALYAGRDIAKAKPITRDDVQGIIKITAEKPLKGEALRFSQFDGKPAKQDIHAGDYFTSENAGD